MLEIIQQVQSESSIILYSRLPLSYNDSYQQFKRWFDEKNCVSFPDSVFYVARFL